MVRRLCLGILIVLSATACGGAQPPSPQPAPAPSPALRSASPLFMLSISASTIVVIDTATHQVIQQITYPDLNGARELTVTPEGVLYVTLNSDLARVYDEMLLLDSTTGAIIKRFDTPYAPMSPRWIGQERILVGHMSIDDSGFDMSVIDTQKQMIVQQFKIQGMLIDTVTLGPITYIAESLAEGGSIIAYDSSKNSVVKTYPFPTGVTDLALGSEQRMYALVFGRQTNPDDRCAIEGGGVIQFDPAGGAAQPIWPVKVPAETKSLFVAPNQNLIILDLCADQQQASLLLVNPATQTLVAAVKLDRKVILSPVTPQGEIAAIFEDGQVQWYDANTLEARGQSSLPVELIRSVALPPSAATVQQ